MVAETRAGRRISEAGENDRGLQVRASFSRLFSMARRVAIAVLPTFVSVRPDIFQTAQPAAPLRWIERLAPIIGYLAVPATMGQGNAISASWRRILELARLTKSGRELIDRAFVIGATVDSRAVKVSSSISDHAVIGIGSIGWALEAMSYSLPPRPVGLWSKPKDRAASQPALTRRAVEVTRPAKHQVAN